MKKSYQFIVCTLLFQAICFSALCQSPCLGRTKYQSLLRHLLPKTTQNENVIEHFAMTISYNNQKKQARWVAHILPACYQGEAKRQGHFTKDTKIDNALQASNKDYAKQETTIKYQKGHLAPSGDFKWSQKATRQSNFYSNIAPQVAQLNRRTWYRMENLLRRHASQNQSNLLIVTGSVLGNTPSFLRTLPIPVGFFKVVYDMKAGQGIAFFMSNQVPASKEPFDFATTIDKIEQMTGIDFFPGLSNEIENKIENQVNIKHWGK